MIGLPFPWWFSRSRTASKGSWSRHRTKASCRAQVAVTPLEERVLLSGVTIFKPPASANDSLGALGMVLGPNGALWFEDNEHLGRITIAGEIKEYPAPNIDGFGPELGIDPAGSIWYVNV